MAKGINSIEDAYEFSNNISDNDIRDFYLDEAKTNKEDFEIKEVDGKYLSFLKNDDGSLIFAGEIEFTDDEKQEYGFDQPVGSSFAMGGAVPVGAYGLSKEGIKNFLIDAGKATVENVMQIGKSSFDYLLGEPGELGDMLRSLSDWTKKNPGKEIELSDQDLTQIGESVFELGGIPLMNSASLINAMDQFPNVEEVRKFTDRVIKDLFADTSAEEKVNKFIATQKERKAADVLGLAASVFPVTSVAAKGVAKGTKFVKEKLTKKDKENITEDNTK